LALQPGKMWRFQNLVDDFDAVNPFGMTFRCQMIKGSGMGV
jgi:hypothetical protein